MTRTKGNATHDAQTAVSLGKGETENLVYRTLTEQAAKLSSKLNEQYGINSDLRSMKSYHHEWQVHNRELQRMNKALERKGRQLRKLREEAKRSKESFVSLQESYSINARKLTENSQEIADLNSELREKVAKLELALLAEQDPTAWAAVIAQQEGVMKAERGPCDETTKTCRHVTKCAAHGGICQVNFKYRQEMKASGDLTLYANEGDA